jgi:1,2-diacylglycerol 3-alpha-glucosyltransferase
MPNSSRRLHIAFVTDTVAGKLGGGVVAGRHLVDALRRRHRVTVVASDVTTPGDLRVPGFQLPIRSMREMQFTMARPDRPRMAELFRDVDVVHVQFPFWLGVAAVEEARRARKPVVAAFHVQPENLLSNLGLRWPWLSRRIYAYWAARIFGCADAVVCPTQFAAHKLWEHGVTTPTHVISNGVPPDLGALIPTAQRIGHEGKFVVLAVGRLAAEKRQDLIIDAVKRSRYRDRIQLVLAGGGPKEAKLRALARDLPNPPELGFLPRERLAQRFAEADLFVHASEVELEGIAVLEAMSAGLPVLVADGAETAASGFALSDDFRFPAGDSAALAAKIDALVDSPATLEAARERYRAAVRAVSFDGGVDKLVTAYRSVLPPAPISIGTSQPYETTSAA